MKTKKDKGFVKPYIKLDSLGEKKKEEKKNNKREKWVSVLNYDILM